jgi:hypothetical protein
MHGSADQGLLPFERPKWWYIFPRQPGEGRYLRMVHSIGDQDLFPNAIVCERLGLTETQ